MLLLKAILLLTLTSVGRGKKCEPPIDFSDPGYVAKHYFTLTLVRYCLKPEYIKTIDVESQNLCEDLCLREGPKCRGCRTSGPSKQCELYIFDMCDSNVNIENCSKTARIYMRNVPGLGPGELCPSSFGFNYKTNFYELVSTVDWLDGKKKCENQPGLTKYADANDKSEMEHLFNVIKWAPTKAAFVGGYKDINRGRNSYRWYGCETLIPDELWDTEYSSDATCNNAKTGIRRPNTEGNFTAAICECLDPFAIMPPEARNNAGSGETNETDEEKDADGSASTHPGPIIKRLQRIGCYKDNRKKRDLRRLFHAKERTAQKFCYEYCIRQNFQYMGLQRGDYCTCGNSYGKYGKVNDSECSIPCPGEQQATCGGNERNEIYKLPASSIRFKRIGCYQDSIEQRDLPTISDVQELASRSYCRDQCQIMGMKYFGLQAGTKCTCGNSYGNYGHKRLLDSECNITCMGDATETCGGDMKNEIFETVYP